MRQKDECEQCLLKTYVGIGLNLPTQYENAKFDKPDASTPWAAVWYMPNVPRGVTAGTLGYDEVTGIFQIDINVPLYSGSKVCRELVDKICNAFPSGHPLVYNDCWVRTRQVGRTQGREVDGWWRVSITVMWYSRLQRLGA